MAYAVPINWSFIMPINIFSYANQSANNKKLPLIVSYFPSLLNEMIELILDVNKMLHNLLTKREPAQLKRKIMIKDSVLRFSNENE